MYQNCGEARYTYVTFRAFDKDGKCVVKGSNITCFNPLICHFVMVASNNKSYEGHKQVVKVEYTPPPEPYSRVFSVAGVIGDLPTRIASWVKALNVMVGEEVYAADGGDIVYTVPEGCGLNKFKFHLFLMRQAFNHPLVLCYFDKLVPSKEFEPQSLWQAVAFLSHLRYKKEWPSVYDDVHSMFGQETHGGIYNIFGASPYINPISTVLEKLPSPQSSDVTSCIRTKVSKPNQAARYFFADTSRFPDADPKAAGVKTFIDGILKPRFEEFKAISTQPQ